MARIELSNIGGGGGGSTTLALTTTGTSGTSVLTTVPGGYSLNIPVYQGALSLSTAGTSGASTLVGDTLTIPTYQGQISLTTSGTSGASTFAANTLNIPQYQGALTLTTTGTSGAATLVGNTLNIPQYSGGGGTPAGSAGEVQFNSTPAGSFAASANLAWDNTAVQLNIGAPSSPTGKLNVKGSGALSSTVNLRLTNNGNTELFKVNDDASSNFGTFAYVDPVNSRMALNTATYDASTTLTSNGTIRATNFYRYNTAASNGISFAGGSNVDVYSNGVGRARFSTICNLGSLNSGTGAMANIRGANTSGASLALGVENSTPTTLFTIANNGKVSYLTTNTTAGTTGAQTIDRPSGTVNFAIGASALVVTNSLCTTSSIVFATVRTDDATATIKNVVPAAGSFTINLGAGATAETSVGFFIIN